MTPLLLSLALSAGPPAPLPPGTPLPLPGRPAFYPPPVIVPVGPPVLVPRHRPMSLDEFVRCFKPLPGTHEVVLLHPVTCKPVRVCFTLPDGCGCPKVKSGRRWVEFDYGRREVEIDFWRNGTAHVRYK